jgi:hypothetical protein
VYRCITVPLPSVGTSPPVNGLDEDINAVRTAVMKKLDVGRDVTVNVHRAYHCPSSYLTRG